jgi:hypothetical protein
VKIAGFVDDHTVDLPDGKELPAMLTPIGDRLVIVVINHLIAFVPV